MPVPWMTVLDTVLGLTDVARRARRRSLGLPEHRVRGLGTLEARLAGVVVAALKEAFDRDHVRLELERAQAAAEHRRTARVLRLDLARQACDRETGRLRQVAAASAAVWLTTLFFWVGLIEGAPNMARLAFGSGWLLLLGALASSFAGQSRAALALDRVVREETRAMAEESADGRDGARGSIGYESEWLDPVRSGFAGAVSPWLLIAGLSVIAAGILLT